MGSARFGLLTVLVLCGLVVGGGQSAVALQPTTLDVTDHARGVTTDRLSNGTDNGSAQPDVIPGDWPTFGHDPTNTGYNPVAPGPSPPVGVAWNTSVQGSGVTPAVVGDTVYVATTRGLYAVDRQTGAVRWNRTGGGFGHVTVANGSIYVDDDDTLFAYDATDGDLRWSVDLARRRIGSQTVVNDTVYVHTTDFVRAVSASNGSIRWETRLAGDCEGVGCRVTPSEPPAVANGTVYAHAADLYALDAGTGAVRWRVAEAPGRVQPVVRDDTVFVITGLSVVTAYDPETGQQRWQTILNGSGNALGSPAVTNDRVVVGLNGGTVTALSTADGTRQWRVEFTRGVEVPPTVANGTIYVETHARDGAAVLYGLSGGTGSIQWAHVFTRAPSASPLIVADSIYTARERTRRLALARLTSLDRATEPANGSTTTESALGQPVTPSSRTGDLTPIPIRTETVTPTATVEPTPTPTPRAEDSSRGPQASTSPETRTETGSQTAIPTTTGYEPDGGLGTGLAAAFIAFIAGLSLLVALVSGIGLLYGTVLTDDAEHWETGLFLCSLLLALYAALRGFTFDLTSNASYTLGPYAAIGAVVLLLVWLFAQPLRLVAQQFGSEPVAESPAGDDRPPDTGTGRDQDSQDHTADSPDHDSRDHVADDNGRGADSTGSTDPRDENAFSTTAIAGILFVVLVILAVLSGDIRAVLLILLAAPPVVYYALRP